MKAGSTSWYVQWSMGPATAAETSDTTTISTLVPVGGQTTAYAGFRGPWAIRTVLPLSCPRM